MRRNFSIFLFYFSLVGGVCGQSMHLLLSQIGEGAFTTQENGVTEPVMRASFLAIDSRITVRARSGLETMAAGYQFRFGSDTRFTITQEAIELHEGSVMFQSRKIGNKVTFKSPEALLQISGSGTCMLEVETNGGLKVINILGRMIIRLGGNGPRDELLAGELVFVKPGNSGLGDKINVNLAKVVDTSFLLSGFENSSSFTSSLNSVVQAQQESIGMTYSAEVGDAKEADTFEIITTENKKKEEVEKEQATYTHKGVDQSSLRDRSSYQIPEIDPLKELLGRSPTRSNSLSIEADKPESKESRPLPGTLLRFKTN
jgi:hypothetical protein